MSTLKSIKAGDVIRVNRLVTENRDSEYIYFLLVKYTTNTVTLVNLGKLRVGQHGPLEEKLEFLNIWGKNPVVIGSLKDLSVDLDALGGDS